MSYIPRLQTQYAEEIAPALKKQFEYTSAMQVPRIEKICLNQGLGKAVADRKMVDT
ncbi:MAG TPA: 50S ribosomal protein L5, partial [Flavobacteriales bacterium]|nr:50S ribosomal protein L5 [Flavobacteriales bacterium]